MLGPLKAKKLPKKEVKELALNKIKLVEMLDKIDSYPDNLSGGQKQRVGIARALAMEPEIILFDEPTSALDPSLVGEVMKIIKKLSFEGITMIIVTHEIAFIRSIANRILFLSEGKVKYDLKTDEFFNSKESTINDYLNIFVYDN
jgi:polar amino acid transport system ATP-binding protein